MSESEVLSSESRIREDSRTDRFGACLLIALALLLATGWPLEWLTMLAGCVR